MTNEREAMNIKRQQRRANFRKRSEFVNAICGMRHGHSILRALAVDALDIAQVSGMTDEELTQLPGVGVANARHIRILIRHYAREDDPATAPGTPSPLGDVIPCGKGATCNWPACPPECLGRPGRGKT